MLAARRARLPARALRIPPRALLIGRRWNSGAVLEGADIPKTNKVWDSVGEYAPVCIPGSR
jgi:hypothetical protein